MTRILDTNRKHMIVLALTLILTIPFVAMAARTAASQTPPSTETSTPEDTASVSDALASISLELPAEEMAWQAGEQRTVTESDPAVTLDTGFIYALDDPLLLLFDDGTPLERVQSYEALGIESTIEGQPVAMMSEEPVPFLTVGLGPAADMEGPNVEPFAVESGEYELSLWIVDFANEIPAELVERLTTFEYPIMVLIRIGEVYLTPPNTGEQPQHLVEGDWIVLQPGEQLAMVPNAAPPVLLIAMLDPVTDLATAAPGSGSSAPQDSGGQGSTGSQGSGANPPTATTTEATIMPTEAPATEQATTAPPTVQATTAPPPAQATTAAPPQQPSKPSGEGEIITDVIVTDNQPIFVPTEMVPSSFDPAPAAELPIFSTGSNSPIVNGSGVERVQVVCTAFVADGDNDGLSDACEEEHGSDPSNADSDGDGLGDGDEANKHKSDPTKFDTDGDKLTDYDEVMVLGSSPTQLDSDGDDLQDGNEVNQYNTDPANFDSDGDGLGDGHDLGGGTDPLDGDFDDDGLLDGDEVNVYGTSPKEADADGDGLTDGEEVLTYGTDPFVFDMDGDCMSDGLDVATGTSPLAFDSDGDGVRDAKDAAPLDPNDDSEYTFARCS